MATVTIKYDARDKFMTDLINLIASSNNVEIIENDYNPDFVKKILSRKNGKFTPLNSKDIKL